MVKISGESNDEIPKKKYICAPDERTINWALKIANNVSRRGGDWVGIVCKGLSEITFVQYRAQLSISQLIADTEKLCTLPIDFKELVKLADDPFVATTPFAGCGIDEIDRIIAEGVLSKAIQQNNGNFTFIPLLGEAANIGNSIQQIRKYLQADFYTISQIHNAFARYMVLNHENIIQQVNNLCGSQQYPLINKLNDKAKERFYQVTEVLLPYARKLALNNE